MGSFPECLISALIVVQTSVSKAQAPLVGEWRLTSMIYQGKVIPPLNPDLKLTWTFFSNGTDRLYWDRGGKDFCERFAHFSIDGISNDGAFLREKTFALNPANGPDCAQDPDMQLGRETKTKIQWDQREIRLFFQLGEEELVYLLTRKGS